MQDVSLQWRQTCIMCQQQTAGLRMAQVLLPRNDGSPLFTTAGERLCEDTVMK